MERISLKIVGSSGQGIDSVGEILAKGLKRSGYYVFGYREYPSLIKGGHASYQLDISNVSIESSETKVNSIVSFNHHGLEHNIPDVKPGGNFIHATKNWNFTEKDKKKIEELSLNCIELPLEESLKKMGAKPLLSNVIFTAFIWAMCGLNIDTLKIIVGEKFAKKKELLDLNMLCIDEGFSLYRDKKNLRITLPAPTKKAQKNILVTGSKAMGLGAVHAGVRFYAGYPMTPSSPLLTYIASIQDETGMIIKQAEDEITAAQMVSGAMYMGTRALTATSGGGFDLMSETLSLNAMIENPTVFVLAQRPGPATGLPTWTGQGDLLMAVHTAHGEFTRCIVSVSNSEDSFSLIGEAFNIAEKYQISVIVLTDKHIAEGLYTQAPFDQRNTTIDRGMLITNEEDLQKLHSYDRYRINNENGISPRWLPGSNAATFVAQGDEHTPDGTVDESAINAIEQMEKRMRKAKALAKGLPEPTFYGLKDGKVTSITTEADIDILLIGWGSTKSVIVDLLQKEMKGKKIGYLHYTYLWPLHTNVLRSLMDKVQKTILVEGNYQGQLGMLIRQESGIEIPDKILKFDGRPFFVDELEQKIMNILDR